MSKSIIFLFTFIVAVLIGFFLGSQVISLKETEVISPFISQEDSKDMPLQKYAIPELAQRTFQVKDEIVVEEELFSEPDFTAYLFSFTTLGKRMTGQLNIPNDSDISNPNKSYPVIVLLRGWVPKESYSTGMGTKNAAAVFAKNGYVTLAPDFFDHGDSDPEPEDSWEARFIKPINVIELLYTLTEYPSITINPDKRTEKKPVTAALNPEKIGIWAHSNGGQIALSVLEIISQQDTIENPIPTTLWAPVTAPFPYSVLFFSDEMEDEGKATRKWLSLFEDRYDVFDFTITKHLDKLIGPIQLHHGAADEAALQVWSDEFVEKINLENQRREELDLESENPIDVSYYKYPGADHNLQPAWNEAIARDLQFFAEEL